MLPEVYQLSEMTPLSHKSTEWITDYFLQSRWPTGPKSSRKLVYFKSKVFQNILMLLLCNSTDYTSLLRRQIYVVALRSVLRSREVEIPSNTLEEVGAIKNPQTQCLRAFLQYFTIFHIKV